MNEFENTGAMQEQTADQQDAFLSGWEDDSPETEQTADQQDEQAEGAQEEQETAAEGASATDEPTEPAEADTTAEGEAGAAEAEGQKAVPASWTIKHLGEEKTLSATDVTPELLQKGMDYDRVRSKYDEARPALELLSQYAKQANMTLGDYAKHLRVQAKQASGMSAEEASRTVELEDREAAVSAQETAQQERQQEAESRKTKINADLAEFAKAFPEVYARVRNGDKSAIPDSVWAEVNGGRLSLTAAYAVYAVGQADQKAAAAERVQKAAAQNQRNAQRSTGSMRSAGNDTKTKSAFLEGFDS